MHERVTFCHSDFSQAKWDLKDISSYSIVNKSKCYDIPGVNDKANFEETVESLVTIDQQGHSEFLLPAARHRRRCAREGSQPQDHSDRQRGIGETIRKSAVQ
jgi:hypothetical protein